MGVSEFDYTPSVIVEEFAIPNINVGAMSPAGQVHTNVNFTFYKRRGYKACLVAAWTDGSGTSSGRAWDNVIATNWWSDKRDDPNEEGNVTFTVSYSNQVNTPAKFTAHARLIQYR